MEMSDNGDVCKLRRKISNAFYLNLIKNKSWRSRSFYGSPMIFRLFLFFDNLLQYPYFFMLIPQLPRHVFWNTLLRKP